MIARQKSHSTHHFKTVTVAFVIGQLLDVATTLMGFALIQGMAELNPISRNIPLLIAAKIVGVVLAVYILERVKNWSKWVWIVPSIVYLVVAWNVLNIVTSL